MADPYAIGTATSSSVSGADTFYVDSVTVGIATAANLAGLKKRTHLRQTFYQSPGEAVPATTYGALYKTTPIISRDRCGEPGLTGPEVRWPLVNYRIETVTPFSAVASPKSQTIRSWGVRLDDSLYQYCSTPWMPEIETAGALAFVRAAHYGGDTLPWALWSTTGATDLCAICPKAAVTHPGTVVPLQGKEYPPAPLSSTRAIVKGPKTLRHRLVDSLFSACDDIFWVWSNGQNSPPKLGWRTRSGWFHPWWGLPPFVETWVNDYVFIPKATATPVYTLEIHIEQETVVYAAGSWSYVITDTNLGTVTVPLSTRWAFTGATDVCAWASIANAPSIGTLAANAIGFRYYAIAKRDGSAVGTVYLPNGYTSSVRGLWCKAPPRSPNWDVPGGNGELYQSGLALQTDL